MYVVELFKRVASNSLPITSVRRQQLILVSRQPLILLLSLFMGTATAGEPAKQLLHLSPVPAHISLQAAPPEATLRFYRTGDIPDSSDRKYLPPGKITSVDFETNLKREPRIRHLLWQVSRTPFYGSIEKPIGLVASGYTDDRVFTIPLDTFYQPQVLQSVRMRTAPMGQMQRETTEPTHLHAAPSMEGAKLSRPVRLITNIGHNIAAIARPTPASFYVRVIPYSKQRQTIDGKPSAPLHLIMGEEPVTETDMSTFNTVSTESFDIRLVDFRYIPTVFIEQWPPGCTPIPRDEGKDAIDVIGEVPGAVVDLVNWASEAYGDLKKIAVSLASALLPFVPESVISFALDAAMAAAGVPPSIPNVDQLMSGGADYLATQMAEQIPIPASGALAEMALGEAREEIRQRTKQALLETANKMAENQRRHTKWCRQYSAEPYFEITLRNASREDADDFTLSVSNSGNLLETTTVQIAHMSAGQNFTVPIAYRQNKNISYKWLSQMPNKDREKSTLEWWQSYQSMPISFSVNVTKTRSCRGDGSCEENRPSLLHTPTRLWDNAPPYRSSGS